MKQNIFSEVTFLNETAESIFENYLFETNIIMSEIGISTPLHEGFGDFVRAIIESIKTLCQRIKEALKKLFTAKSSDLSSKKEEMDKKEKKNDEKVQDAKKDKSNEKKYSVPLTDEEMKNGDQKKNQKMTAQEYLNFLKNTTFDIEIYTRGSTLTFSIKDYINMAERGLKETFSNMENSMRKCLKEEIPNLTDEEFNRYYADEKNGALDIIEDMLDPVFEHMYSKEHINLDNISSVEELKTVGLPIIKDAIIGKKLPKQ